MDDCAQKIKIIHFDSELQFFSEKVGPQKIYIVVKSVLQLGIRFVLSDLL